MADDAIRSATDLDEQAWSLLDDCLRRFEASWKAGDPPQFGPFLPDCEDPLRELILIELIKIDQEYRWNSPHRKKLEDYLVEWPELANSPEVVTALLEAECLTRTILGDRPSIEEIAARFPAIYGSVDLAAIRARKEREENSGHYGDLDLEDTSRETSDRTPSDNPTECRLAEGQSFGRYGILGCLGRGGMGTVYRAYDTKLHREVALKIPHLGPIHDRLPAGRLVQEARLAAKIDHPNICTILDADQIGDIYYVSMKLIQGQSLADRICGGAMEPAEAARLAWKVASALAAVHAGGVVHRDIKPSNVMIDPSGEPLLTDFGLARPVPKDNRRDAGSPSAHVETDRGGRAMDDLAATASQGPGQSRFTGKGDLPGTLAYMSPEQIGGEEADARSDIYSLGVLLYQTLTGILPFSGEPAEVAKSIRESEPPAPRSIRPELAPELEAICLKAMAKRRSDRYSSASDLAEALRQYLEASSAAPPSRHRRNVGIAAAAILLLLGVTIYFKTGEGTLTIEVAEPNATVTVDGLDSANQTVVLSVGEHVLEVGKEGFETHNESLVIRCRGQNLKRKIELEGRGIERWIGGGAKIAGICLTKDDSVLYAAYNDYPSLSRVQAFDVATGGLLQTIDFKDASYDHKGIAISADDRYLFVTNYFRDDITRIDLRNGNAQTDLPIGGVPGAVWATSVAASPDGKRLLVVLGSDGRTNDLDNDRIAIVSIADGRFAREGEVRLDDEGQGHTVAFDSDGSVAYVATLKRKSKTAALYRIRLAPPYEVTTSAALAESRLWGLSVSSRLKRVFVSDLRRRKVLGFDAATLKRSWEIDLEGREPWRLALDEQRDLLAVLCRESRSLYLVDAGTLTVLGKVVGLREFPVQPLFSSDHRRLFVAHARQEGGVAVIDVPRVRAQHQRIVFASDRAGEGLQLYAMDGEGRNVARLTYNHATDCVPRWSPDGRRMAYVSNRSGPPRIFIRSLPGADDVPLPGTDPVLTAIPRTSLDWSPDGKQIVFVGDEHKAIRIVRVETGKVETKLSEAVGEGYAEHLRVSWSKDGTIVFHSQHPANCYLQDVFRLNPTSGKVARVTDSRGQPWFFTMPAVSPDGKRIAVLRYAKSEPTPPSEIFLMNADGTGIVPVAGTGGTINETPRWSRDGEHLVYSALVGTHRHIFMVSAASGEPVPLTTGQWDDVHADIGGMP